MRTYDFRSGSAYCVAATLRPLRIAACPGSASESLHPLLLHLLAPTADRLCHGLSFFCGLSALNLPCEQSALKDSKRHGSLLKVLLFGYKLARSAEIHAGELLSFVFYLQALSDAFNTLGDVYANFATALGASHKVSKFFEHLPVLETSR